MKQMLLTFYAEDDLYIYIFSGILVELIHSYIY